QQRPDIAEGDPVGDQILDVHAAVAQRAAVFIGFGDIGGERDHPLEAADEIVRDLAGPRTAGIGGHTRLSFHQNSSALLLRSNVWPMSDVEESGASLAAMRAEYGAAHPRSPEQGPLLGVRDTELDENSVAGGWEPLVRQWIDQATAAGIAEPNAMVLGTVDSAGPVARP